MTTSSGDFPKRLTRIDELTRPDHYYIEEADRCYFIGEYTAGAGYGHSQTNDLISNLKKDVSKRNKPEWYYKEQAIERAAAAIGHVLYDEDLTAITLVPVPPSKAIEDTEHDDRMARILRLVRARTPPDVRELIVQIRSTNAVHHDSNNRLNPDDLDAVYAVAEEIAHPIPRSLVVVDDMLTTGAHFKAAQRVLQRRFPQVPVVGLFIARRVPMVEPGTDIPF